MIDCFRGHARFTGTRSDAGEMSVSYTAGRFAARVAEHLLRSEMLVELYAVRVYVEKPSEPDGLLADRMRNRLCARCNPEAGGFSTPTAPPQKPFPCQCVRVVSSAPCQVSFW